MPTKASLGRNFGRGLAPRGTTKSFDFLAKLNGRRRIIARAMSANRKINEVKQATATQLEPLEYDEDLGADSAESAVFGAAQADDADAPADVDADEDDGADEYVQDAELEAALEQSAAFPPLRYTGGETISGLSTRNDIVQKHGAKLSENLVRHLAERRSILFMPRDLEEHRNYHGGLAQYEIHLFGPLADGSKAHVVLTGAKVFFDVRVPDAPDPKRFGPQVLAWLAKQAEGGKQRHRLLFEHHLREILLAAKLVPTQIEDVEAHPVFGVRTAATPIKAWKRLTFSNLQDRKKAIELVRDYGHETASDDRSAHYRKVAREYGLTLSDWLILRNYEYEPGPCEGSPLAAHYFRVDISGVKSLIDPMASKEERQKTAKTKQETSYLCRDRTLVLTWDSEARTTSRTGDLPRPENEGDEIFMICGSLHWKDDPAPLHAVCIVDVDTAPDPRWTTIVCETPANVLKAFALVVRAFAPDIICGFNDADFDWPFVITKAAHYGILGWMYERMSAMPVRPQTDADVRRWRVKEKQKVKISPEDVAYSTYLKVPGFVPLDVRVCFRKLFPKSEVTKGSSLKFYLSVCGLPGKADMPIARMWTYDGLAQAANSQQKSSVARFAKATERLLGQKTPQIIRAHATARTTELFEAPKCDWKALRAAAAALMREVAHYCFVDALSCQRLLVRRNVVNDNSEVSTLSFVSFADSHFYAGGMKVCNLLTAYALRRGFLCSNASRGAKEENQYPGAWVFHPEKGLVPNPDKHAQLDAAAAEYRAAKAAGEASRLAAAREVVVAALEAFAAERPVTGLDFQSLYPSIIMAYNLSTEKITQDPAEAERLRAAGMTLHPIQFMFGGRPVQAWSIRHANEADQIGLYPTVLIDLFNKRREVKSFLAPIEARKELLDAIFGKAKVAGCSDYAAAEALRDEASLERRAHEAAAASAATPDDAKEYGELAKDAAKREKGLAELLAAAAEAAQGRGESSRDRYLRERFETTCFEHAYVNAKQLALKVFMNTFYGEAGNSQSPFFLLALAGGVTEAGQYNIKLVAEYCLKRGFHIKYGDTDSLYLVCPAEHFAELDWRYVEGELSREQYWTQMVKITMRVINAFRDEVNAFLAKDNGTKYLAMGYEEVLYPVDLTGKKKYFGIPHINIPNFRPKKLFIRGVDVVKQGQTQFAKDIGYRIMWAAMRIDNARTMQKIVEDVLADAIVNGAQWNFDHFVRTDAYKPTKNNVAVQRFVARMHARHAAERAENARLVSEGRAPRPYQYEPPEAGERFQYVLCRTGEAFDLRGYKANPKKGDVMEYAGVAKAQSLPIDVATYVKSYVIGLCARFINFERQYQPPAAGRLSEKQRDAHAQKAAKKALELFVRRLNDQDPVVMRRRGYAYRRAYTAALADAQLGLREQLGPAAVVLSGDPAGRLGFSLFLDSDGEGDDDGDGHGTHRDPVSRAVERLVTEASHAAAEFAETARSDVWCAALAARFGIAADGSDIGEPTKCSKLYRQAAQFHKGAGPNKGNAALDRLEASTRAEFAALAGQGVALASRFEAWLEILVHRRRAAEHAAAEDKLGVLGSEGTDVGLAAVPFLADEPQNNSGAAEDRQTLGKVLGVYYRLLGISIIREQDARFAAYLLKLKNKRLGLATRPTETETRQAIDEGARKFAAVARGEGPWRVAEP